MSNLFTERVLNMAAVTPQPEDYTGEDGLLYCGKCHTPKEAYFPEKQAALFGRDRHPAECDFRLDVQPECYRRSVGLPRYLWFCQK